MTISSEVSKNAYTGNGATNTFAYTFVIFDESHLDVYLDGVIQTSGFTVSGVGNEQGGSVIFTTSPDSGVIVTLNRDVPLTQNIDYIEGGPFPAETHESGLDLGVQRDQQLQEQIDRGIKVPITESGEFETEAPEAGKGVVWNDELNGFRNVDLVDGALVVGNGQLLIFPTVAALKASTSELLVSGINVETQGYYTAGDGGGASYLIQTAAEFGGTPDGFGDHVLDNGNVAVIQIGDQVNMLAYGLQNGVDGRLNIQAAQNKSELLKLPVKFPAFNNLVFSQGFTFASWLHWIGSGKEDTLFKPSDDDSNVIGGNHYVRKANLTVDVDQLIMEHFGTDPQWAGGWPTGNNFVGWCAVEANGSNDKNIHYRHLAFYDTAFDVTVHRVIKNSGGTIDNISMEFCDGRTNHVGTPNRNANMFKTIHGTISDPGPYGVYPITNVRSYGNTCTHMRSLCDFRRGTRHFQHDGSTVIDMSDVCSISVDGGKDGTIGPENTGYQTNAFADAKNFYEIQGEDIEVLGGVWDANDRTGVVAGLLVTDYIYPAEENPGVYDSNPSVNVNCRSMTTRNIASVQSAVRYINTKTCDVRGVNAFNIGFAAVSFEYQAGKKDINAQDVLPQGNSVDHVKERDCQWALSVSNDYPSKVKVGNDINDAAGNQNILVENTLAVEPPLIPLVAPEELNINKDFENYAGTAQQPLGWQSGSATRNVQTADKPFGVLTALESGDTDPASIQATAYQVSLPCKQGDVFYFTVDTKLGTSTRSSLNIQEFTDVGYISSNFITLNATANWERRVRRYKVTDATCTRILVSLQPAANSSVDSSFTGTSFFTNFRISKKLNNY